MDDTETGTVASAAASGADEPKRMAIICWSNDLDRVWPVMILATTGAASGLEVDKTADCIVLQFEIPLETVYYTIQFARKNGIRCILNPAPA
ncbi:MAG: hypothetical protein ACLP36_00005, partial [Acidimicrobiales bacterium]